jgi:ATP-dependent DNA helicase RecG
MLYGFAVLSEHGEAGPSKAGGLNGGLNEGLNEGINEGIKSLLVYIEENPGKRITSIAAGIGKPAKTIERWIKKLRKDGKIEFRRSKKTGGYYVMGK